MTDSECTVSSVPNLLASDVENNLGPYEGIFIGTAYCD